jgi:hypothetical protein
MTAQSVDNTQPRFKGWFNAMVTPLEDALFQLACSWGIAASRRRVCFDHGFPCWVVRDAHRYTPEAIRVQRIFFGSWLMRGSSLAPTIVDPEQTIDPRKVI